MRSGLLLIALFLTGCAVSARDDFGLRKDIVGLNLIKIPIAAAKERLAGQGFACEKDYEPYAGSPLRAVNCTRVVAGIACRDNENVALEYRADSGLVDRVTTGRANGCN